MDERTMLKGRLLDTVWVNGDPATFTVRGRVDQGQNAAGEVLVIQLRGEQDLRMLEQSLAQFRAATRAYQNGHRAVDRQ